MEKKTNKAREERVHVDWIAISAMGAKKRGPELLKNLRDAIGIKPNEKSHAGYGRGWYFEQFIDLGFRISANDEGSAKVELQGLFFNGATGNPFQDFLRIAKDLKKVEDAIWRLTCVDVAIDVYGLGLDQAFPNPKSKKYDWAFAFKYSEHQTKSRKGEMLLTGYTIRRQRWKLTVYDKRIELIEGNPHPIKKSYFDTMSEANEPITRIELRVNSAEALSHVQSILQNSCTEIDFCNTILKKWGDYHKIRTSRGNDESRFHRLFRNFKTTALAPTKQNRIGRLQDEYKEIKLRDLARNFIRFGLDENKNMNEVIQVFREQVDWLLENENTTNPTENIKAPETEAKADPSGED